MENSLAYQSGPTIKSPIKRTIKKYNDDTNFKGAGDLQLVDGK